MTIKPLRRVAVAFVASQCLIGMTTLVAASESAMGADASETSAVQAGPRRRSLYVGRRHILKEERSSITQTFRPGT